MKRFEARLVTKGYIQKYGVNYHETFALVAKTNTIQVLLSLVVNLNMPLQQFDVKNAFLYWDLEEEDGLSPSFANVRKWGKICRLKKYGPK